MAKNPQPQDRSRIMELWKYIQILGQRKQGWLFRKDNAKARLIALNKILELGFPSSIQNIIPFLKDENEEIRQVTCKVITELFRKIETRKGFYNALKHCDISKSDIEYYGQEFSREEALILYAIASLNSNGYVREKAVNKLAETNNEQAIPFIVYRLADWVQPVRNTALKSIKNFKKTEFINALVENLAIFEWLQKVRRTDLRSVYNEVMNFVVVENKQFVNDNFRSFSDRTRAVIAKQIASFTNIQLADLKMLLADKYFLVRNYVLSHFDKLTQKEIAELLADKSARVRIQTLYKLKSNEEFTNIVFPFLFDNSASIREFARYSLKNCISDFTILYNKNLIKKVNVVGSLSGLAETNGKRFVESVVPYLTDARLKVKKIAFLALKKLYNNKAYEFALHHLDSEYIGLRNIIIEYLADTVTTEVLQKAREIYANGGYELKKSMLKLFSKVGRWTTIADIMIGTIDENEYIRQLSVGYLQVWQSKTTTYFMQPKQDELERSNQVFRFVFEVHEEKKYFSSNPLIGIDFYLR